MIVGYQRVLYNGQIYIGGLETIQTILETIQRAGDSAENLSLESILDAARFPIDHRGFGGQLESI